MVFSFYFFLSYHLKKTTSHTCQLEKTIPIQCCCILIKRILLRRLFTSQIKRYQKNPGRYFLPGYFFVITGIGLIFVNINRSQHYRLDNRRCQMDIRVERSHTVEAKSFQVNKMLKNKKNFQANLKLWKQLFNNYLPDDF